MSVVLCWVDSWGNDSTPKRCRMAVFANNEISYIAKYGCKTGKTSSLGVVMFLGCPSSSLWVFSGFGNKLGLHSVWVPQEVKRKNMPRCNACGGDGWVTDKYCEGKGIRGVGANERVCSNCGGSGILRCPVCDGSGVVKVWGDLFLSPCFHFFVTMHHYKIYILKLLILCPLRNLNHGEDGEIDDWVYVAKRIEKCDANCGTTTWHSRYSDPDSQIYWFCSSCSKDVESKNCENSASTWF